MDNSTTSLEDSVVDAQNAAIVGNVDNSAVPGQAEAGQAALHEHKDSLVTIRLSEMDPLETQQALERSASRESSLENSRPGSHVPVDTAETASKDEESLVPTPDIEETSVRPEEEQHISEEVEDSEEYEDESDVLEDETEDEACVERFSGEARTLSTQSTDATVHAQLPATLGSELEKVKDRTRSLSMGSSTSSDSAKVNWAELDKDEVEEKEQRDEGTDESTAFLLARLEQENNALLKNPKAGAGIVKERVQSCSRPPSLHQLKKLVTEPTKPSLRYSMLPSPPPMTELEFWSALVRDYPQTAQRLPTLTSNKIRGGIPPPLRGVVWMSIAGARDSGLEEKYDELSMAPSPYEKLINKDIGRSFPGVDMFRDADGEGQKMLGRVLSAFSLWDQEIGYCQGLGFVVGPMLMHMGDKEAFCVLVRLMEHYDLRSCFLPDLSGLHLRIYQFQHLLTKHLPELTVHLEKLNVEPLYLSQWFLSFFGVTCPLPMLIRIYDVILTEGASETLMRVALSLMRRNEKKILAATEFEDIMQLLLSRSLWDTYGCNADDLVNDFVGWTGLVTREGLTALETEFKNQKSPTIASKPSVHSAASRFLGRFWTGSSGVGSSPSSKNPSPTSLTAPVRPASTLRRTPSKQSMASTLNSIESSETTQSAASTDATGVSRSGSTEWPTPKASAGANITTAAKVAANKDKDLHSQIEDLLMALSDMQREHSLLATELQREREEREEDRLVVGRVIERMKKRSTLVAIPEDSDKSQPDAGNPLSPSTERSVGELEDHFAPSNRRSSLVLQTKHQLREEVAHWKDLYTEEVARSAELSRQLTDRDQEVANAKEELREARSRIQDAYHDRQRLERTNRELRSRKNSKSTPTEGGSKDTSAAGSESTASSTNGLREFKLGRNSTSTAASNVKLETPQPSPAFSKRISSLSTHSVLATDDHRPPEQDAILLELVNSKTAEALARQELEEVKGKLDALRKLLAGNAPSSGAASSLSLSLSSNKRTSPPSPISGDKDKLASSPAAASSTPSSATVGGGFFSGWGKRTVSGTTA